MRPTQALLCALLYSYATLAQRPPQPENINLTGTSFLDHEAPIKAYLGRTFLRENIPYIDIPDPDIQNVYYYRWSSLSTHLRYTTAGSGYILTEFVQPVGYAQTFDTIDAAAGHQIDEARWLRSNFYDDDYIQIYTRGPGNSVQYTQWILDATYRRSHVNADTNFLIAQLQGMLRIWNEWDFVYDDGVGLYYYTPVFDAQEYSLPGYVYAAEQNNPSYQLPGPNTYRPSHNSYMVANARAIAATASIAGNKAVAFNYSRIADAIEAAMYDHLWNTEKQFFVDVIVPDNQNLTQLDGREEVGLYPFRFGIGLEKKYADPSYKELFDPQGFLTTYGPTTLEVRNQYYDATKPTGYCCYWNGQSWPFSTAHVLKSLAAMYRSKKSSITASQYYQYMRIYAATQHKNGEPYVAESHYPSMDAWSADSFNHSEGYDHSTNNDDVITGLIGLVPRADNVIEISPIIPASWNYFALENVAYHGHLLTILYDADGNRYHAGSGLSIFVDGVKIFNGKHTQAKVQLPKSVSQLGKSNGPPGHMPLPPRSKSAVIPVNIAANPLGLGAYPLANATYTFPLDDPYKAIDGFLFYNTIPDNRWTNYQSPHPNDTLQITFPRPRNFSSVTLAVYSDVARNGAVDCPQAIEIYGSSGLITKTSPFNCLPNDLNTIDFGRTVESDFVAVNFFNKPGYAVGVCELQIWMPPDRGVEYYAVDAILVSSQVAFNQTSQATSNGAVVTNFGTEAAIRFSGIYSDAGGSFNLNLSYANPSSTPASIGYSVNQIAVGNTTLHPTGGLFSSVSTQASLLPGNNFITVSLIGGDPGIMIDVLRVQPV